MDFKGFSINFQRSCQSYCIRSKHIVRYILGFLQAMWFKCITWGVLYFILILFQNKFWKHCLKNTLQILGKNDFLRACMRASHVIPVALQPCPSSGFGLDSGNLYKKDTYTPTFRLIPYPMFCASVFVLSHFQIEKNGTAKICGHAHRSGDIIIYILVVKIGKKCRWLDSTVSSCIEQYDRCNRGSRGIVST